MSFLNKFFRGKKSNRLIKKTPYICKWCDYTVFPGEYHEACQQHLRKYKCNVCNYPLKPGRIHYNCLNFLKSETCHYAYCIYCKKVCIPDKPHNDCVSLKIYNQAENCLCCGFKILPGLDHRYCARFTIVR